MALKVGNYVRCSIDEDNINSREFIIGKIMSINDNTDEVLVKFYDIYDKNKFFQHIPYSRTYYKDEIDRCKVRKGSMGIVNNEYACRIKNIVKERDGEFYSYYVEPIKEYGKIIVVSEKDIAIQYDEADYSPVKQMISYELHNPIWYKHRSVVTSSMNAIQNSPDGFELLLGSRVYLFPHQIDAIIKGITQERCRLMLADEVGLGKTIEACVIFKGLKRNKIGFKSLIIVPKSLINQWKNELSYKFWIDALIWDININTPKASTLLLAIEDIQKFMEESNDFSWDICIVDETHRLLNYSEHYEKIYEISKNTDNILLLSATPIQQRKSEYLSLLRLLNPERYKDMTEEQFDILLEKCKMIKDKVYELIRDIKYYYEDELWDDYIDDLEGLSYILNDNILNKLIDKIDINDDNKGLETIKIILAYISNTYDIDKSIIRNRKLELASSMAKRTKLVLEYQMMDASYNFFELESYNALLEYLEGFIEESRLNEDIDIVVIKDLISAMLSSPWALKSQINKRILAMKEKSKSNNRNIIKQMDYSEEKELKKLRKLVGYWNNACQREFDEMDYYEAHPEEIKGRLIKVMDHLDQYFFDKKVVIFSQWTETASIFEKYLKQKMGEESVVGFFLGKSMEELELSVDRFQNDNKCRFLICDKLGGEGRNFQIADAILHLDIPWSPIDLEQRIGRLDRIGREKSRDILSIVILANGTIEMDLYNLWDKTLNIFDESLSGIEIALNDVEKEINDALMRDIKNGLMESYENLSDSIIKMRHEVEKERYFDYAKRLNPNRDRKLNTLIQKFDNDGGELLRFTMDKWAGLVGLLSKKTGVTNSKGQEDMIITYLPEMFSINSAKISLFNLPNTQKALQRSRSKRELRGTFSTDLAVNREDLIYFSPGDEIFDSIVDNAKKAYRGRSMAAVIKADFEWAGLIYKWNTGFNYSYLLEKGYSENIKFDMSDFLILDQITTFHPVFEKHKDIDPNEVKIQIDNWINSDFSDSTVHLGKRSGITKFFNKTENKTNIEWFKSLFTKEIWDRLIKNNYIKSRKEVESKIKSLMDLNEATKQFDDVITSIKARNIYFQNNELEIYNLNDLEVQKDLIIAGLRDLELELDSIALIWMVKNNE